MILFDPVTSAQEDETNFPISDILNIVDWWSCNDKNDHAIVPSSRNKRGNCRGKRIDLTFNKADSMVTVFPKYRKFVVKKQHLNQLSDMGILDTNVVRHDIISDIVEGAEFSLPMTDLNGVTTRYSYWVHQVVTGNNPYVSTYKHWQIRDDGSSAKLSTIELITFTEELLVIRLGKESILKCHHLTSSCCAAGQDLFWLCITTFWNHSPLFSV